jgi:hypothetical protein
MQHTIGQHSEDTFPPAYLIMGDGKPSVLYHGVKAIGVYADHDMLQLVPFRGHKRM